MRNQSYAIAWHGAGGDGLRQRTSADLPIVNAKADQLRQAAGIARNGASDISAAQRRAVEDAQNADFNVGEDLSVTDTRASSTPAEQAARQAQAQAFAGDIRLRAEQLQGADLKVAGQLTTTTADLGTAGFAQNPISNPVAQAPTTNRNGVQLVDFTQDSGAGPAPPFAPWDTPDGTPPPPQPAFIPQYEQNLTAPPAPTPPPGAPIPSSPPPVPSPATGSGSAAAAKPGCSAYDATKALLEPAGGMIAILTAVPEGATGVGIPAALGQIALGTAAVADGLDAAGKCLD